ncbi:MAG TPA: hypothetical protein VMT88_07595 [Actinomycetes bacterium]|nr:hypothetical protein [Actinomycetes bacterium]
MQATIRSFDAETHAGTVLLDDGVELPFDADAFAGSGMRTARLGQRVRIQVVGAAASQRAANLRFVTFPEN